MRARRRPLIYLIWHNSTDPGPQGPPEPMPPWVKSIAEKEAKPGTTFLILNIEQRFLCHAGCFVVQSQDGRVYPIDPDTFKMEYEVINVAKPIVSKG